jgi:hypothetical protein
MKANLADLNAFVSVARAGGFRDGARVSGTSNLFNSLLEDIRLDLAAS